MNSFEVLNNISSYSAKKSSKNKRNKRRARRNKKNLGVLSNEHVSESNISIKSSDMNEECENMSDFIQVKGKKTSKSCYSDYNPSQMSASESYTRFGSVCSQNDEQLSNDKSIYKILLSYGYESALILRAIEDLESDEKNSLELNAVIDKMKDFEVNEKEKIVSSQQIEPALEATYIPSNSSVTNNNDDKLVSEITEKNNTENKVENESTNSDLSNNKDKNTDQNINSSSPNFYTEKPHKTQETIFKERLIDELNNWNPIIITNNHLVASWIKSLKKCLNKDLFDKNEFFSVFYEVKGIEIITRKILSIKGPIPSIKLKILFSLCIYGTENFHSWFIGSLRNLVLKFDESIKQKYIEIIISFISLLKIPIKCRQIRKVSVMKVPDKNVSIENKWKQVNSSISSFTNIEEKLYKLHQELVLLAPNSQVDDSLNTFVDKLNISITETEARLCEQQNLQKTNIKAKNDLENKDNIKISALEEQISDIKIKIESRLLTKTRLLQQIAEIDKEIHKLSQDETQLQSNVDQWKDKISDQIKRFNESNSKIQEDLIAKEKDVKSMKSLQTLLFDIKNRLKDDCNKIIYRFSQMRDLYYKTYLDSALKVFIKISHLCQFYQMRFNEANDIFNKVIFQQKRAQDLGLELPDTNKNGLKELENTIEQDKTSLSNAQNEVRNICENILELVDSEHYLFKEFLTKLGPEMDQILDLSLFKKYINPGQLMNNNLDVHKNGKHDNFAFDYNSSRFHSNEEKENNNCDLNDKQNEQKTKEFDSDYNCSGKVTNSPKTHNHFDNSKGQNNLIFGTKAIWGSKKVILDKDSNDNTPLNKCVTEIKKEHKSSVDEEVKNY